MKTIGEIIEYCMDGKTPTIDEMRYTICCMHALSTFDGLAFMRLAEAQKEGKKLILTGSPDWQYGESFNRWKRARQVDPLKYLGDNNNPDRPEVQERRKLYIKISDKIIEKIQNKSGSGGSNETDKI